MESNLDFSAIDTLLEFLNNSPVVPPQLAEYSISYLVIIKANLIDPPQEFLEDGLLPVLVSFLRNIESIFSSFDFNKMNEYMALDLCLQLLNFLDNEENWPDFQRINVERAMSTMLSYPKTSAFVFIDHLLENLEELLKNTASSTWPFNYFILRVQRELRLWYSDLVQISSDPPMFLKEVIEKITKLAYDVEYVLDSFLVGDLPSWLLIHWLVDIFDQFQKIEQERIDTDDEEEEEDLYTMKTRIYDKLLGGDEQLNIITIVGWLGIDKKKAFVKELYNSPSIIDHFETRACCSYDVFDYMVDDKRPLLDLLGQLIDLSDLIRSKNYEELTKLAYKSLAGQKFLVVIDDLGDILDWVKIQRCFPDSHNGSRILLTTHVKELDFTDRSKSIRQPQSPQNDQIWESLFENISCPAEMLEVRMKIARRCKPESRTQVVHLLQTIQKSVNQWEEVAQSLGSRIFGLAGSQENRILDFTCIFLPDHLRSCFFYLRVFRDQVNISVSELIQLWIAEGFVKFTASQSLESTAEDYVADLMVRNLLVLTEDKSIGGAKSCCVTPVVCDFLSSKVMEDNFLQIKSSDSSSTTIFNQQRLIVRPTIKWHEFVMFSGPFVQSLFYETRSMSRRSNDMSFIYNNFKFLRILKFDTIIIGDSFIEISALVLLRYLAIESFVDFIPPSIANLWNLETFIFQQSNRGEVKVPDCIWDMTKLRHLQIYACLDLEPHKLENSSSIQDNLQTLGRLYLTYGDDMEKILRRLTSIRKLACIFEDSWDDDTKFNRLPVLEFLDQLISLKVDYEGRVKYPCRFNLPSNLKKLTLNTFRMPWNEISQLAMLNNLEVLKLIDHTCKGQRWEMEDDVAFPKLKYLKLKNNDLKYCSATRNHFPQLEHLIVKDCKKLVEIPQDFAYISSILMIEMYGCTSSAESSVILIQEQHMNYWGHDDLEIYCCNNSSVREE